MKAETVSPRRRPDSTSSNQDFDDAPRSSSRKRPMRNIEDDEWIIETPKKKNQRTSMVTVERKQPTPKPIHNNSKPVAKAPVKVTEVPAMRIKTQPQIPTLDSSKDEDNSSFEQPNSASKKLVTKVQKLQVSIDTN